MKPAYYEKDSTQTRLAVIDLYNYFDRGLIVTRLNVPESMRGNGVAKRLLTELCTDADSEKVTLWLEFQPYPGTNRTLLSKLYRSFGFKDRGGIWCRLPAP